MKRRELVDTLTLVGMGLAKAPLVPIFGCFCFRDEVVTAYNDEIGVASYCGVEGTFAVHGDTLLGLLQACTNEEVSFELERDDVLIKSGKSTLRLPYFAEEAFLFEAPSTNKPVATLSLNEALVTALNTCLLTSSRDNTQPAIMGVTLGKDAMYSCDGDAVTKCTLTESVDGPALLLPNAFCESLLKLPSLDGDQLTLILGWAIAEREEFVLYGRLPDIPNPLDHEKLIKQTLKTEPKFVPVPDELRAALNRARVVADPDSAKTTLEVSGNKLTLLTQTALGVVRDVVPFKHVEVQANVSAAMMARALGVGEELAILPNCTVYRCGEQVLQVLSNMA